LIWLAANYDPEKYKKVISSRDCESANIAKICDAIMNPVVPFALRLSAQLLLGTVRVYRTKTKLCLELAEQTMLKLSTLIREANLQSRFDLQIASLRAEAVTLADTGMGMIDYSLEPVYYDANMILHMNEDDFFSTHGGSQMNSPIKLVNPKKDDEKNNKLRSPLTVSNRKISIEEDLLSPTKPIQVPGEDDLEYLGGFGPLQDDFLLDLNLPDIPDLLRDEGTGRLTPVFEKENMSVLQEEEEDGNQYDNESRKRKLEDGLPNVVRQLNLDEEVVFPEVNNIPEENLNLDKPMDQLDVFCKDLPKFFDNVTAVGEPKDWADDLFTPADVIILKPKGANPRKKRKLNVDKTVILDGNEIRNNLSTPESLIRIPIIAGTALTNGKELFKIPVMTNIKCNKRRKQIWKLSTSCQVNPQLHINLDLNKEIERPPIYNTTSDEDLMLPEIREGQHHNIEETPGTIEIARAGNSTGGLQSFEHSAGGSILVMNQTPATGGEETLMKSYEDVGVMDNNIYPDNKSPRISDVYPLPGDMEDINFNNIPDLEPVMEEDEPLVAPALIPDDNNDGDNEMAKHFREYQKTVLLGLRSSTTLTFKQLFPIQQTKRRKASLAFYTLLHLHKNNQVVLEQKEVFDDIFISRGTLNS